jgi:integrase
MNEMERVSVSTFLRSKQTITVAIDFLNWLTEHEICLAELRQNHLDVWQAEGPTTRLVADRFLRWAIKTKAVAPDLSIQRHRRSTSPRLSSSAQEEVVHRVVHTDELTPRDRAAAILVLVFGQQIEDVVQLTWDDVNVTEELVTIRLGSIDIALTDPLDGPWRQLARRPGHDMTAAHPRSRWVFRGYSPGRHIHPATIRNRLSDIFSARAARLGTLHELAKLAPVAVIAETLGYSPTTIERQAVGSAVTYAQYVAAAREQRNSGS